jgi:glutathione synthase/RimK-type ligase-like ATP-grasp enzyme
MIERHPDSGSRLDNRFVPQWEQVLEVSRQAQRAIPLGYVGVDVCVDRRRGPLVLEVNARPGLEIQNVRGRGLRLEIAHTLQSKEPPTWPAG